MSSFFRCCVSFLLLYLGAASAYAQIAVTFPFNRMVFQRDNTNKATIQIAGNYYQTIDKIEVKLTPINSTWGTAIDWTVLQSPTISNGAFSGSLSVNGGWYTLQVRASFQNAVIDTKSIDRVGVGEVLLVAGQSNAQGDRYSGTPTEPSDDRVNVVTLSGSGTYEDGFPAVPQDPKFKKMGAFDMIVPNGVSAWCWGRLGDLLAQQYNVPVLFYNAGKAASMAKNWRESSEGKRTQNRYCTSCGEAGYYPQGLPYDNLKTSLNYYASLTGIRGVIWHQGEADDAIIQTPMQSYYNDLLAVINKSREDFGYTQLSWLIARASYNSGLTWQPTIDAQTQLINTVPNIYPGPFMDGVDIPRYGAEAIPRTDVHYTTPGILKAAEAWFNSFLTSNFLSRSTPKLATPMVSVIAACAPNNSLTLTVPSQTPYAWSNGQTTASITVGQGEAYMGRIKNGNNTIFTFPYKVPDKPVIGGDIVRDNSGNVYYCEGVTPVLKSNYATNNTWSTGATTQSITAASTGNFGLTFKDAIGCTYTADNINLSTRSRPAKPSVTVDGATSFCEGTVRTLTTVQDASGYKWSNGITSKTLQPTTTSAYTVQIMDANQCYSVASDPVQITVNPNPAKPSITANRTINGASTITICANENVELTSSPSENTYTWNFNNATTASVTINQAGSYQVRTVSRANCSSPLSDPVFIRVNPLPNKPVVNIVQGTLAFCEGQTVTMQAISTQSNASWILGNTLISNSSLLTAKISGDYYAQATDANNCKNLSDKVTVSVRPNPQTPVITLVGPYTLEAKASISGTRNSWFIGSDTITLHSVYLKPPREGVYRVRSVIEYNVAPVGKFECASDLSAPYNYMYDPTQDGFVVYPNPSPDGNFVLETKENWQNAEVIITSSTGLVVYSGTITHFNERKYINLGRLPGIYVLRMRANGFERSKRIMVMP